MKGDIVEIFKEINLKIIELIKKGNYFFNSVKIKKDNDSYLKSNYNKNLSEGEEYKILFEGLKGLVVEDNKINSIVISEYLEYLGISTDTAFCADELLEKIKNNIYDVIFLDMHLNDTEIINIFGDLEKNMKERAYIIACTVKTEKDFKEKCFKIGIDGFIEKPLIMKNIVMELKNNFTIKYKQESMKKINNSEILEKMRDIFVRSYPKEMKEMRIEIEMKLYEKAEKRVHRLKSGAGDLKENSLYKYLSELEENLKEKDNRKILTILERVECEVEKIVSSYIG